MCATPTDILVIVLVAACKFIHKTRTRHNTHPACLAVIVKSLKAYDVDLTAGLLLEAEHKTLDRDTVNVPESHVTCKVDLTLGINTVSVYRGV